jgi:hypothetical protein
VRHHFQCVIEVLEIGNSSPPWLCLRQPARPSVGNSLQPSEAFAVLNLSLPAIASGALNSTSFFQLLHNKNLMWDAYAPHKSKLGGLFKLCSECNSSLKAVIRMVRCFLQFAPCEWLPTHNTIHRLQRLI